VCARRRIATRERGVRQTRCGTSNSARAGRGTPHGAAERVARRGWSCAFRPVPVLDVAKRLLDGLVSSSSCATNTKPRRSARLGADFDSKGGERPRSVGTPSARLWGAARVEGSVGPPLAAKLFEGSWACAHPDLFIVYAARRTLISASNPAASTNLKTRSMVTFCKLPERTPVTALRGRPERCASWSWVS
jgi:hypothetical protein